MARTMSKALDRVGVTAPMQINVNITPVNVSVAVILSEGAILTYTIEHIYENIWTPDSDPNPTYFPFLVDKTESADGYYAFPVTGVRLRITAHVQGTATLKVIQAGTS